MGAWGLLGVSLALPSGVTHFHWDWAYVWKALPSLLKMIPVTLELAICGIFFGTLIGLLIALMKISHYSGLSVYLGSPRYTAFGTAVHHLFRRVAGV